MESILFLGTAGGAPTKERNLPSLALKLQNGRVWLVDCGDGTQYHFIRSSACKLSKVDAVFLTHLHSDHMFGVPGLLSLISLKRARTRPFVIVGPVGIKRFVECAIEISCTNLCFPIQFVELDPSCCQTHRNIEARDPELLAQCKCGSGTISISAYLLSHVDMPSFGYVFEEPGKVSVVPEKVAKIEGFGGGRDLRIIKEGGSVVLANGRTVRPEDVLDRTSGRMAVVLGDTLSPESGELLTAANGCDVVVHECTFSEKERDIAVTGGHSTAGMAGNFARLVGAQTLILNHFSSRNDGVSDKLLEEAVAGASGCGTKVLLANDYKEYSLKKRDFN